MSGPGPVLTARPGPHSPTSSVQAFRRLRSTAAAGAAMGRRTARSAISGRRRLSSSGWATPPPRRCGWKCSQAASSRADGGRMRPTARRQVDRGGSGARNSEKGSVRPWSFLPGRCVPCAQSTDSLAPWPLTTSARPDNLGLAKRSRVPAMHLRTSQDGGCRVPGTIPLPERRRRTRQNPANLAPQVGRRRHLASSSLMTNARPVPSSSQTPHAPKLKSALPPTATRVDGHETSTLS